MAETRPIAAPTDTDPETPPTSAGPRKGSALVGWALTGLTCVVLLVGVLIIRHTSRDERPAPGRTANDPPRQAPIPPTPGPTEAAPAPIVLMPTPPADDSAALPRPLASGIDLASGEFEPGFSPIAPPIGGGPSSGGIPRIAGPKQPPTFR